MPWQPVLLPRQSVQRHSCLQLPRVSHKVLLSGGCPGCRWSRARSGRTKGTRASIPVTGPGEPRELAGGTARLFLLAWKCHGHWGRLGAERLIKQGVVCHPGA